MQADSPGQFDPNSFRVTTDRKYVLRKSWNAQRRVLAKWAVVISSFPELVKIADPRESPTDRLPNFDGLEDHPARAEGIPSDTHED